MVLVVPARHRRFGRAGLAAALVEEVPTLQYVVCVGETAHPGPLSCAVLRNR